MVNAQDDKGEEILDLLHGRLPDDEAARLSQAIEADPLLKAEHRLIAALGATDTARHAFPGELGFARLSKAIDQERRLARPPQPVWRRGIPAWQAAAAVIVAVLAWQFVAGPLIVNRGEPAPQYTTATGPTEAPAAGPLARVAFVPEASEETIRTLLREAGARIVDGPNALGFYVLAFADAEARGAALQRFEGVPETVAAIDLQDDAAAPAQ